MGEAPCRRAQAQDGQHANSEAFLLPYRAQFIPGHYFQHGDLCREAQEPKMKMPTRVTKNAKPCQQEGEAESMEVGGNAMDG